VTVEDLAIIAGLVFAWGALPLAVALAGARLGRPAVLFVDWFGPRGLASVVFALLALEDPAEPATRPAITVIAFTVLLSVLAHGLSATASGFRGRLLARSHMITKEKYAHRKFFFRDHEITP
jgi:NhaP-type Na+/H+ or K+/H+ antiporter